MVSIPSTPADGNVKVLLVPAIADPTAPTVAELTGAGVVDISCYLTGDGWAATYDQATISDDRLCSTQVFGQPGRKTLGLSLTVIDNTNSDNETEFNEAVETLVEGQDMFAVYRAGIPFDDAVAAAQKVRVWPFKPGMKQEMPPEANSVLKAMYPTFITADVNAPVAVVAGA